MLSDILTLRADALSSKLCPMYSGSLTRVATELPTRTLCLAATSTSQVHPRTRIRHLSDAFHKVHKSVSLLRISSKHLSYGEEDSEERKQERTIFKDLAN